MRKIALAYCPPGVALAMATTSNLSKDRNLLAAIGDEVCQSFPKLVLSRTPLYCRTRSLDFCWPGLAKSPKTRRTSLLLSLVRYRHLLRNVETGHIFVFPETEVHTIEATFTEYTQREDIAILLINQHVRAFPVPPVAT